MRVQPLHCLCLCLLIVDLPAAILGFQAVSREMTFSSVELIQNLRCVQTVCVFGEAIEEWRFQFGFVIPGSVNTWQCTIEAAGGPIHLSLSLHLSI